MTLPQLYRNLTLTSYDKIRYRGDQPEGMGGASPFSMGLNAVIIRPYASLVRSLTLRGDWRETELEEHARVGRVPDSSMMLNIAVRAAIDRMPELESFSWELNTKMLETVYLGLAQLPKLTSLTVRFPSSRHPRPTIVIPPMPRLRVLKVTDIDPLCYPDDISTLLLKSRKLRELKMHWSPRMRNEQEPSVMLLNYFKKCIAAKQPLAVKKIALQNLYALHSEDFDVAFNPHTVEDVTILNNAGQEVPNFMNTFVDSTWPTDPPSVDLKLKSMRQDALSKRHSDFLGNFTGLQRLYFVNVKGDSTDALNSPKYSTGVSSAAPTPSSGDANVATNGVAANSAAASPASGSYARISLRDSYINNIITNHAATLRHLLLPACWPLPAPIAARLVHACPHLEQLGVATEISSVEMLGLLLPFLRNLVAVRILVPTTSTSGTAPVPPRPTRSEPHTPANLETETITSSARSLADIVELDDQFLTDRVSEGFADKSTSNLKVIGFGRKAWELRDFYTVPAPAAQPPDTITDAVNGTTAPNPPTETEPTSTGPSIPPAPVAESSTPTTSQMPSYLGKRRRDNDSPALPASGPTVQVNEPCGPDIYASDGQVWRRRVRRVGWDVLQHWAIWALDSQEI